MKEIKPGGISVCTVDDYINQEKQKGIKEIIWDRQDWELLECFVEASSKIKDLNKKGFIFMEIKHILR